MVRHQPATAHSCPRPAQAPSLLPLEQAEEGVREEMAKRLRSPEALLTTLCSLHLPRGTEGRRGRGGVAAPSTRSTCAKLWKKCRTSGGARPLPPPGGGGGQRVLGPGAGGLNCPPGPNNPEPPMLSAHTGCPLPLPLPRCPLDPVRGPCYPPRRAECTALGCSKPAGWAYGSSAASVRSSSPRPAKQRALGRWPRRLW